MSQPRVSILMSVYNGERYLRDSIQSILNQTFTDFEFIIIDDGSTDGTSNILDDYGDHDPRIMPVQNRENIGLTNSLNKGVALARGEFIARQDADDISSKERLRSQVHFLDEHPEVGVAGTWVAYINERNRQIGVWRTPTCPALVRWSLLFGPCLAHPSVMMRHCLFDSGIGYNPEILYAQDYELWARLSTKTQLANVPEVLYLRRVHEGMIGAQRSELQEETVKTVMQQIITRLLGQEVPETIVTKLRYVTLGRSLDMSAQLRTVAKLIMRLYKAYGTQNELEAAEHGQVAGDAAFRLAELAVRHVERWPIKVSPIMLQAVRLNRHVLSKRYLKGLAHGVLNAVARRK